MSEVYGYVRVSTKEQNEDRQMIALRQAGIRDHHIFIDKQSGKDFERQQYLEMVGNLKSGDVLYIVFGQQLHFEPQDDLQPLSFLGS